MKNMSVGRLRVLVRIWNQLARHHSAPCFQVQFRPDLEELDCFQRTFPHHSPAVRIRLFEAKILGTLRLKFPREGILRLRSLLNQSN